MNRVSTPPVAMAKLAPMSVNVGAPVPSFVTSCHRVWVPSRKPMPIQLMAVASVSLVASAAVDPLRPKTVRGQGHLDADQSTLSHSLHLTACSAWS